METVLQGPDGKPAVDEQSGKSLTMEEMLRRRGIVRMGNTTSMIGPDSAAQGVPSSVASSTAASSALKSRTGGASDASNPAAAAALAQTLPPDLKNATPEQAAQTLASTNTDPSMVQTLEGLGLVAAGTAAAYAIYKMRGPAPNTEMPIREGMPAGVPEDAHFTDIPNNNRLPSPNATTQIEGPSSVKAVRTQQRAQLDAPQKRLTGPAAMEPTAVAKAVKKTPRVPAEALDAGVTRTLGMPSELVKMLKANPGLLKTLTRIP